MTVLYNIVTDNTNRNTASVLCEVSVFGHGYIMGPLFWCKNWRETTRHYPVTFLRAKKGEIYVLHFLNMYDLDLTVSVQAVNKRMTITNVILKYYFQLLFKIKL